MKAIDTRSLERDGWNGLTLQNWKSLAYGWRKVHNDYRATGCTPLQKQTEA
jgi:hypothetical protein